jgi:hypothetical protein
MVQRKGQVDADIAALANRMHRECPRTVEPDRLVEAMVRTTMPS